MSLMTPAELDSMLEKAKSAPLPTRKTNSAPWCMQVIMFASALFWLILSALSQFDEKYILFGLLCLALAGGLHSLWERQKLTYALQRLLMGRPVGGEGGK